jgi:hypothetical protein
MERPALLSSSKPNARRLLRWGLLAGTAALLGGCAGFSPDGGMAPIQAAAYAEIGKDVVKIGDDTVALTAKARVDQLLRKPLTADSAVQIALLNNRGLQASFNELGIAEAQMVAASLPPNPRFGISKLSGRFEVEIERQIVGSLLALITCRPEPRSPATASGRRNCARSRQCCGSRPMPAASTTGPSPPMRRSPSTRRPRLPPTRLPSCSSGSASPAASTRSTRPANSPSKRS